MLLQFRGKLFPKNNSKMKVKTYSKTKKLYDESVYLSKNWMSKYYSFDKHHFNGIPIEKIQAFSQHHFFSSLLGETPIDDIWSQYPQCTCKRLPIINGTLLKKYRMINIFRKNIFEKTISLPVTKNTDIVIVSSGRHLSDLKNLISNLNEHYKVLVIGKILDNDILFLKKEGVDFINIRNARQYLSVKERLLNMFGFVRKWQKIRHHKLLDNPLWEERLNYLQYEQFPEIKALAKIAERIFNQAKPMMLITSSSNDTFGASFSLTAQHLKIPVAEIQHGLASWEEGWQFSLCDYMLVWGKVPKNLYRKFASKIIEVGLPFFERPKVEKLGVQDNKRTKILILWSPPAGYWSLYKKVPNDQALKGLLTELNKNKIFSITIRSHPSYSIKEDLLNYTVGSNVYTSNEPDVSEDIKKHDIIITGPTTAGFISILLGKPLLYFDNSLLASQFTHPFLQSNSSFNIPLDDVHLTLDILNNTNNKKLLKTQRMKQKIFIEDYVLCFGENSCKKILSFVERFVGQ